MLKVVLLFFMLPASSFAAISPPWVILANRNCNGETACIDSLRNNEMESFEQFQKNNLQNNKSQNRNLQTQYDDFLVQECLKQKIDTQEMCVKMYKQNHLKPFTKNQ